MRSARFSATGKTVMRGSRGETTMSDDAGLEVDLVVLSRTAGPLGRVSAGDRGAIPRSNAAPGQGHRRRSA